MLLDELKNPNFTNQYQKWNFVTDQVMGGESKGKFQLEEMQGIKCYRMTGNVSTKNNGGFIQIRTRLHPKINTKNYNEKYTKWN